MPFGACSSTSDGAMMVAIMGPSGCGKTTPGELPLRAGRDRPRPGTHRRHGAPSAAERRALRLSCHQHGISPTSSTALRTVLDNVDHGRHDKRDPTLLLQLEPAQSKCQPQPGVRCGCPVEIVHGKVRPSPVSPSNNVISRMPDAEIYAEAQGAIQAQAVREGSRRAASASPGAEQLCQFDHQAHPGLH